MAGGVCGISASIPCAGQKPASLPVFGLGFCLWQNPSLRLRRIAMETAPSLAPPFERNPASLPFLNCKFFAKQKTYETIVAGIHAGPAAPFGLGKAALFPTESAPFFVMLIC
jgi:hypothetical protein